MTSKEKLKQLRRDFYIQKPVEYDSIAYFTSIEKDLEVLEILKRMKWSFYANGGGNEWNWFIDTNQSMLITKEDADKIREWLKNEKERK